MPFDSNYKVLLDLRLCVCVFKDRPPVDGALEANKPSIVILMRNCTIFMIASNKFSSFRSRNTFYFQAKDFVLAIYCSQSI